MKNGIRHVKTAPYHPSSNGQAEWAVQVFKEGLKKFTKGTLETKLARFLFQYRLTPHTTTGIPPAELLMGRQLRSHLNLCNPDLASRVHIRQEAQKNSHDRGTKEREFQVGDQVLVRNFAGGPPCLQGKVLERRGILIFS